MVTQESAPQSDSAAFLRASAVHGGGASRGVLAALGILLGAAGAIGLYGTWRFAGLTAWELPAWILLAATSVLTLIGLGITRWAWTARDRRTARARLLKATISLCSTVLSAILVNAGLGLLERDPPFDPRAIWPDYDPAPFERTSPLCEAGGEPDEARYPPNLTLRYCLPDFHTVYHTTADGTRNIGRAPAEPLTLAIGDSFTYGWGVPDDKCFAARLGWVNAGLWGRPPSLHIRALRWWAPRLRPHRVVWGIYPPHLITELPEGWRSRYQYPALAGRGWERMLSWYHETGVGRFLHRRFGFAINRADYFTKESILYETPSPALCAVYDRTEAIFREARELSAELGFELWFVLIPSKACVARHLAKTANADLPIALLKERLHAAGIDPLRIIDLTPLMTQPGALERYYFAHDAHWNEMGHEAVADFLARRITP